MLSLTSDNLMFKGLLVGVAIKSKTQAVLIQFFRKHFHRVLSAFMSDSNCQIPQLLGTRVSRRDSNDKVGSTAQRVLNDFECARLN